MSTVDICYSKDGGRNESSWKARDLGETGDFMVKPTVRRLGRGDQWVVTVRVTDPIRADLYACAVQIEGER